MTIKEKLIISAYTGVLMCDMDLFHRYIEVKLGRPVQTFEMATKQFWKELKDTVRKEFLELCKEV